jgi:hypothetical protein
MASQLISQYRWEHIRVSHEEKENCLTLKMSNHGTDLANGCGHDPTATSFFKGLDSRVVKE